MSSKKVLILGAGGMLGHTVYTYFHEQGVNVSGTRSSKIGNFIPFTIVGSNLYGDLESIFSLGNFSYVINCLAETSSAEEKRDNAYFVNAYLPKLLSYFSIKYKFQLYHISTNGIFSGKKGPYSYSDIPDDVSSYGITKFLGETIGENSTIIRTSIIGIDTLKNKGFINWILASPSESEIVGYNLVYWNGITTLTLAQILLFFITNEIESLGIMQIAGESVSKLELLQNVASVFQKKLNIVGDNSKVENKTLSAYNQATISHLLLPLKDQLIALKSFHETLIK